MLGLARLRSSAPWRAPASSRSKTVKPKLVRPRYNSSDADGFITAH